MKKFLWFLPAIFLATRTDAQSSAPSNAPVRLALIAETEGASSVCDILTAEFSKNSQISLLERNDIEKVYREQSLSSANRNYLKLGQVLGADGLLLITRIPGVWALPKGEIKAEMARQIQERRADLEGQKRTLLAKYDLNHNGEFDPDEKESAISDPAFLKFELGQIDANDNGKLDCEELAYFDANKNGILDPPEESGIHAVQNVLAGRLLKALDRNENGRIDDNEFQATLGTDPDESAAYYASKMASSRSETERLAAYLEYGTESMIRMRSLGGQGGRRNAFYRSPDFQPQTFKQRVESYWARQKANPVPPEPNQRHTIDQRNGGG